ncbi:ATP-binding protein [Mesomycoplasma ovipneumoniae]|uniref:ATP-binding protein n=1 Tax=Mesomycoplasma ovipneumoniae TaxID=29562 RepID=A0AAJ2P6A1_9BACT|nr:ATP-binding protein [Mesomycoplasma ovipneumoniae]MDW2835856.1 ATP-binding protein [Mesomycoplasma ovipneumoniae]MDW2892951.1 ATP-binding protein [Mesomycoplasma ovipneumoniae]MDW2893796.1 ATP-binding protein [Mesomycoplasma ovipneumoniae]MDW2908556.1 ATP-binding protein [Mesomycoplasma ovipneumoniae]WNM13456.1 ATP-binding protein [Mesomycoplasma ovipneumoniae]
MIIKRDFYLNQIIDKKENDRIKIITGIRRCGKSYLLFNLYRDYLLSSGIKENQIITIALDQIDNIEYRNPFRLNVYIKKKTKNINKMYYIFIDEIQLSENVSNPYIESNEKNITFVDVLLSLMKHSNLDIYITGSNSKMLSSDLLTQFRDRGDQVHVNPLSFAEVYELFDDKSEAFEHYFVYGGMPHIYKLQNDEQKSHYLKQLFKQTYIKDILEHNQIHNEQQILEILLDFTSSNIGSLTNPSKLANRFLSEKQIHISSNTIFKYLKFFEESYIIQRAYRYDVKGSKYFSTPLKYYFSDIGLRNARLNFRQIENTHIMENIIYNDLLRRGYNIDIGVVEHEFKNGSTRKKIQLEIDFVINKSHKRYYIQSALNIDNLEKKEQEITSLKKINDSFKKIVIVRNKIIPKHDENGILYIGLEDFLLNESIIDL